MNGNNDLKYVMLPRIEEKPKIIKQQPWYKERLKEKYLSSSKSTSSATASKEKILNPRDWVFIKDGLDDFRDGLPPSHDDVLIKVMLCFDTFGFIFLSLPKISILMTNFFQH